MWNLSFYTTGSFYKYPNQAKDPVCNENRISAIPIHLSKAGTMGYRQQQ